ncbi:MULTISPECIES: DUF4064 domain-containing protein [Listeria]|uniref:DUF4064 domain-containing protein n=1 Tax=Listeria TaxID=1637 RepID=UPI0011EB085E|nr:MULTISPECIES: DUF4064 domain-containing protein [Listeria]EBF5117061.1 hypothetical protein [Listeria monocytogenes]EBF5126069.1 hypothetical protein [Listeria monocytogenes]EHK4067808.1 hypothetical protein [Listeria monocytogenes]MBC2238735.1 hypothetical protein [Listeria innocua]TYV33022.1 hypothetical protein FZ060_15105 [Listeria monocytogenes]
MNPRKIEFILTLIAGIMVIIDALKALLNAEAISDNVDTKLNGLGTATGGMIVILAVITLVIGIALIVFAVLMKRNAKLFGTLTLVAGAVGFFLAGVPGVLAIIAGIMCLARKVETV